MQKNNFLNQVVNFANSINFEKYNLQFHSFEVYEKTIPTASPLLNLLSINSQAQQRILLLSGKYISIESYQLGSDLLTYKKTNDKRKKLRIVDRYDVFSIETEGQGEQIIYTPADSLDFSIEEARLYIQGEQVASEYYKARGASISSAIVGAGSGFLSFYAIPVPMIYSIVLGRFNPKKMKLPENFDQNIANTEAFQFGYKKSARNTKIQQSLKWGYISLGVSLTGLILYGIENH
ncbi:MAG: hypothetical protein IPK10_05180 [Bacteroidetes bacterium]|nr:hypothetical protein [Bacteroidota bacterium]